MAGSIALLLWGSYTVRDAVEQAFAARLKSLVAGGGPLRSMAGGVVAAFSMQSATATVLLATALLGSGLLSVGATMGVVLGADLGSALAVRVLFLDLSLLPPVLLAAGVFLHLMSNSWRMRCAGRILVGLGLMLLAIQWLKLLIGPFAEQPLPQEWLMVLRSVPWMALIAVALATWFAHSSVALVLVVATFAHGGQLPHELMLPMLLGANIGAGLVALPLVGRRDLAARSVVLCNLGCRIALAAAVLLAAPLILPQMGRWDGDQGNLAVLLHIGFNALLVLLFLPVADALVKRVLRWQEQREEGQGGSRMSAAGAGLDPALFDRPEEALASARREASRLGDITEALFARAMEMFAAVDRAEIERTVQADREINSRNRAIHRYLSEARRQVSEPELERQLDAVLHFSATMENIGDIVSHDLARLAVKRLDRGVTFSAEGLDELGRIHTEVLSLLRGEINSFIGGATLSADRLRSRVADIRALCEQSVARHRRRLSAHRSSSQDTSSIHQDTVRDLLQIAGLMEHRPDPDTKS